jgi:hypothetical protein
LYKFDYALEIDGHLMPEIGVAESFNEDLQLALGFLAVNVKFEYL